MLRTFRQACHPKHCSGEVEDSAILSECGVCSSWFVKARMLRTAAALRHAWFGTAIADRGGGAAKGKLALHNGLAFIAMACS